jgi:putative peptidoglycan lipid II flippase
MSAFPAMATGSDAASLARAESTLGSSARAIIVATCAGAAVLFAIASPTGAFFSALDAGRHSPAGRQALVALPDALSAFAPGLVGFGVAALFTRALYVQGRPAVAGGLVALGWLIAAVVPLVMLHDDAGPRNTLQSLGLASSFGMTVAAIGLIVAVQHAWGPRAFRGLGRSAVVALGAGALAAAAGRGLAGALHPDGLAAGAAVAALVASAVVTLFAVSIWIGDRQAAQLVVARLPGRARREITR